MNSMGSRRSPFSAIDYLFGYLLIANFLQYLEAGAVPALLIQLAQSFNMSAWQQGLLGGVVYLSLGVGGSFGGYLLRQFEHKYVFLTAVIGNMIVAFCWTMTPVGYNFSASLFIGLRFLMGLFQCVTCVYLPLWTNENAPRKKKTIWMSYLQVSAPLGVVTGYIIASIFLQLSKEATSCYGLLCWRWPFLIEIFSLVPLYAVLYFIPTELLRVHLHKPPPFPSSILNHPSTTKHYFQIKSDSNEEKQESVAKDTVIATPAMGSSDTTSTSQTNPTTNEKGMAVSFAQWEKALQDEVVKENQSEDSLSQSMHTVTSPPLFPAADSPSTPSGSQIPPLPHSHEWYALHPTAAGTNSTEHIPNKRPRRYSDDLILAKTQQQMQQQQTQTQQKQLQRRRSIQLILPYQHHKPSSKHNKKQQPATIPVYESFRDVHRNSASFRIRSASFNPTDVIFPLPSASTTPIGRTTTGPANRMRTWSDLSTSQHNNNNNNSDHPASSPEYCEEQQQVNQTSRPGSANSVIGRYYTPPSKSHNQTSSHDAHHQKEDDSLLSMGWSLAIPTTPSISTTNNANANTAANSTVYHPFDHTYNYNNYNNYNSYSQDNNHSIDSILPLPLRVFQQSASFYYYNNNNNNSNSSSHSNSNSVNVSNRITEINKVEEVEVEEGEDDNEKEDEEEERRYIIPSIGMNEYDSFVSYDDDEDDSEEEDEYEVYIPSSSSSSSVMKGILQWYEIMTILLSSYPIYTNLLGALSALYFTVTGIQYWSTSYLILTLHTPIATVTTLFAICAATGPTCGVLIGGYAMDWMDWLRGYQYQTKLQHIIHSLQWCCTCGCIAFLCTLPITLLSNVYHVMICIWLVLCVGGCIVPCCMQLIVSVIPYPLRSYSIALSIMIFNLFGYGLSLILSGLFMQYLGDAKYCDNSCQITWGFRLILFWSVFSLYFLFRALATAYAQQSHRQSARSPPRHSSYCARFFFSSSPPVTTTAAVDDSNTQSITANTTASASCKYGSIV